MKEVLLLLVFVFLVANISGVCENEQIDINTASVEELDGLTGIGAVKAQAIIDSRPFDSVDDLIDVYGIGNATLEKIKTQGLACVEEEKIADDNKDKESVEEDNNTATKKTVDKNIIEGYTSSNTNEEQITKKPIIESEAIILTGKSIKSANSETIISNNYAVYGFIGFCILLGLLFGIKYLKKDKNEFER